MLFTTVFLKTITAALIATCSICFSLTAIAVPAEQVTIQVNAEAAGGAISDNFAGLGFEVAILREENGTHYFRPDNAPLIQLFQTLGIKSLRVGAILRIATRGNFRARQTWIVCSRLRRRRG